MRIRKTFFISVFPSAKHGFFALRRLGSRRARNGIHCGTERPAFSDANRADRPARRLRGSGRRGLFPPGDHSIRERHCVYPDSDIAGETNEPPPSTASTAGIKSTAAVRLSTNPATPALRICAATVGSS